MATPVPNIKTTAATPLDNRVIIKLPVSSQPLPGVITTTLAYKGRFRLRYCSIILAAPLKRAAYALIIVRCFTRLTHQSDVRHLR